MDPDPDDYWRYRPKAPTPGTILGRAVDIANRDAREFVFGAGVSAFRMVVVREGPALHAYLNLCPHFSLPLNREPGAFHASDRKRLLCSQHFAEFEIATGLCVLGACKGEALDRIPVRVDDYGQLIIG